MCVRPIYINLFRPSRAAGRPLQGGAEPSQGSELEGGAEPSQGSELDRKDRIPSGCRGVDCCPTRETLGSNSKEKEHAKRAEAVAVVDLHGGDRVLVGQRGSRPGHG